MDHLHQQRLPVSCIWRTLDYADVLAPTNRGMWDSRTYIFPYGGVPHTCHTVALLTLILLHFLILLGLFRLGAYSTVLLRTWYTYRTCLVELQSLSHGTSGWLRKQVAGFPHNFIFVPRETYLQYFLVFQWYSAQQFCCGPSFSNVYLVALNGLHCAYDIPSKIVTQERKDAKTIQTRADS